MYRIFILIRVDYYRLKDKNLRPWQQNRSADFCEPMWNLSILSLSSVYARGEEEDEGGDSFCNGFCLN